MLPLFLARLWREIVYSIDEKNIKKISICYPQGGLLSIYRLRYENRKYHDKQKSFYAGAEAGWADRRV